MRLLTTLLVVGALAGSARADGPIVLRMASVVPEGTAWSHEMRAMGQEIEHLTQGQVKMKWYLGAIAGDDIEAGERVRRDQLDGLGGGAWQCERWAPSMKVTRLPGLFADRAEHKYIGARLRGTFDEEFKRAGFIFLGETEIGPSMIFTRTPVDSLAELRRTKLWSLDNDDTKRRLLSALGFTLVPLPFGRSRKAFDDGTLDGFLAPPTGALAFQWSTQARYLMDGLVTDYILGCLVVAARAFDRIPVEQQKLVRAAAAKFLLRFDLVGAHADEELLGGLFERQGVKTVHLSDRFRAEFQTASRGLWDKLDETLVPKALLARVQALIKEYREHPPAPATGAKAP